MTRRLTVGRETLLALLSSLVVAAAMTWPTLLHPASRVPSDLGDPLLQAWTIGWDGHALLHQLGHPFDANDFFPLRDSLGFSDSLFGYAPLGLLGHGVSAALVRYNLAYVLVFAGCSWGAYLLARQLGIRPAGAVVAGATFAYAPWRGAQAGHLNILSSGALPLALALLARGHGFGRGGRTRPALALARPRLILLGWAVAAWQLTLGFGVGLQWAYLLAGLTGVTLVFWLLRGRPRPGVGLLAAEAGGVAVFGLTGLVFAVPYLVGVHDHPEARRSVADLALFSPPVRGFFTTPEGNWLWGAAQASGRSALSYPPEMALGLGLTVLVLGVLGLVLGSWSRRRRVLLAGSVLVLGVFAMGTAAPFGGRWTYLALYHHLPGFSGIRTPGRLVITMTIALALLAASGAEAVADALARFLGRQGWSGVTGALLAGLVLLEGVTILPHPQPAPAPVAALNTGSGPLLVLPSDEVADNTVLLWTTEDYQPIANGSSGFVPTSTDDLRRATDDFPATGIDLLRSEGVRRVAVLLADYPAVDLARFLGALPPGVTRQLVGDVAVFQLGPGP